MSSHNDPDQLLPAGFVCLLGPTNAGKSTFLNHVLGEKVAIATPKPQTTRNRILGIHTVEDKGQIVFMDTPGLHRATGTLGKRMNAVALESLQQADVVLLFVDAVADINMPALSKRNSEAVEAARRAECPVVVALNKVDKVSPKEALLPVMEVYSSAFPDSPLVPISAAKGSNVDALEGALFELLPKVGFLYPPDSITDQTERFLAAEIIREKLMLSTQQELPYSVAVEVEEWKEPEERGAAGEKGQLVISAVIHVERESQKGIVIGKGGERLKHIGTEARQDMKRLFATSVHLNLFVRVQKGWTEDPRSLDRFGYR